MLAPATEMQMFVFEAGSDLSKGQGGTLSLDLEARVRARERMKEGIRAKVTLKARIWVRVKMRIRREGAG